MRTRTGLAIVAVVAAASRTASGDGFDPAALFSFPPAEFLEKSYIVPLPTPSVDAPGPGGESYRTVFEGQLVPHLFFYNDLDEQAESGTSGLAWAFSFTFQVRVRLYDGPSFPLRTPSMNPRIAGQIFYVHRPGDQLRAMLWSGMLAVSHHSNGQEWCPFEAGVRDRGDACSATAATVDIDDVNLENGSFSTNFVTLGLFGKHSWLDDFYFPEWTAGGGLVVEVHPQGFGPGAISELQSHLYGAPLRPRLELEGTCGHRARSDWSGLFRVATSLEVFHGHRGAPSYRFVLDGSHPFFQVGGLGPFVRFQSGQDNYNINFVNRIDAQLMVGVTWDPAPPPRYSFADGGT